jgi:hypothetical protein
MKISLIWLLYYTDIMLGIDIYYWITIPAWFIPRNYLKVFRVR